MLIQINDPSAPKIDKPLKYALGIDFGTTHCVAGVVRNDTLNLIPLDGESFLLPSVVSYQESGVSVGKRGGNDSDAIFSIKRIMGRTFKEADTNVQGHSFQFENTTSGLALKTEVGLKKPVEVAKDIFQYIKKQAETYLGQKVSDAVVTVPAYFDEVARASIKDAAALAGFNVLRLVAEPTAAALAYGLDEGTEGIYIVYDLGGGTFDVSVLRMRQGVFQVLATGGDAFLGGDDIDALIVKHFLKDLDLRPDQQRDALTHARHVKERLSSQLKATFDTPLGDRCVLKREIFESLIQPFVTQTLNIMSDTIKQSGVEQEEIQGVILVGGSTRIPYIHGQLDQQFKLPLYQTISPDDVVAMGAAQQAHLLTNGGDSVLVDVTPLSLGIEMMGGIVDKVISRNTPIPIRKAQNFTTFQDNQTGIVIHVVQGERELAKDCRSLGKFTLTGIPPMPAGVAKVKVVFALDADGLLTVSATEENTGIAQEITIKPTYGLDEHSMAEMITESHKYAREDIEKRLLEQTKVEANQLIHAVEQALNVDAELLFDIEKSAILKIIQELKQSLHQEERGIISKLMDLLEQSTEEFAYRRVQKHLKD